MDEELNAQASTSNPPVSFKFTRKNHLRTDVYRAPLSPFPNFVYEMYDLNILVERIHQKLAPFQDLKPPRDPVTLSYWVANNFPISDYQRMQILSLNSPNQRLRYEMTLIDQ